MNIQNKNMMYLRRFNLLLMIFFAYQGFPFLRAQESPRIINIVNFIRQTDYRVPNSDSLLFDVVERQIALSKQYKFPTTFLIQYDALINPQYQKLIKSAFDDSFELGAWWEITQPHVEAAGIKWRGEHRWVSTANIAFTPGYTKAEREKLVDVYMQKFHEIYGKHPKSVGSWFIDSHTLMYMYEKYGIVASSNCKDQVGTDGYTLWGGYWNQAYYPSKLNAYMPAQTKENQIPVPIFRMLGSDPMYQYDAGIGTNYQNVISLEPVYHDSGKNKQWVQYFLESIAEQPSLAFNYAQAGQENSFTWAAMAEGLNMQFPLFDSLRNAGKIHIKTLGETGAWFKEKFPLTPATAVTTWSDIREKGNKSIWYNSRYYRSNVFFEQDSFCFRDIHIFDERMQSSYLDTPGTGKQFFYYTLPVVDRFHWSTPDEFVGLKLVKINPTGESAVIVLQNPEVFEFENSLRIISTTHDGGSVEILFEEESIKISGKPTKGKWALELSVPQDRVDSLPFTNIRRSLIEGTFQQHNYAVKITEGTAESVEGKKEIAFRLIPSKKNSIKMMCNTAK